jgi:hypothetical protein
MEHAQLRDESYANFEKNFLQPNGVTIADYKRYVRHQAAIQQLFNAVAVPGRLTTPAEAETLWRKENQQMAAQLAVFWTSNFLDKVTITNGALGTFYTNRASFYRLPERLTLTYVEFTASNYLGEADTKLAALTNLNEIVSDFYSRTRMDTNRWTDTNGAPLPEAAAKEKIKEEFRLNEALAAARRAAAGFGNQLMNQPDPNKVSTLETLAKSNNLPVKITKPFDNPKPFDNRKGEGLEEIEDDPIFASSEADAEPEISRIRKKERTQRKKRKKKMQCANKE